MTVSPLVVSPRSAPGDAGVLEWAVIQKRPNRVSPNANRLIVTEALSQSRSTLHPIYHSTPPRLLVGEA